MNERTQQPVSSRQSDGEMIVRGAPLTTLIATASFLDTVFLLLRGDRPTANERGMLDAMLVACCDHGEEPPSTTAARLSASTGNALHVALAAGLLAMGPKHGCAVTSAMEVFSLDQKSTDLVHEAIATGRHLPGFGHRVYVEYDPRTAALLTRAEVLGTRSRYVERALAIEAELAVRKGKKLPLNIDGCLAALLLELRFPLPAGNAIFILGRLPGLAAHAMEAATLKTYMRDGSTKSQAPSIKQASSTNTPN